MGLALAFPLLINKIYLFTEKKQAKLPKWSNGLLLQEDRSLSDTNAKMVIFHAHKNFIFVKVHVLMGHYKVKIASFWSSHKKRILFIGWKWVQSEHKYMELKSTDFDWSLRRVMKDNSILSLSLFQFERLTFGHLPWETPLDHKGYSRFNLKDFHGYVSIEMSIIWKCRISGY